MKTTLIKGIIKFSKTHSLIIRVGLLTAAAIILFQVISLFVLYRYMQIDYALCLVALSFLAFNFLFNRRFPKTVVPHVPDDKQVALLSAKEIQVLHLLASGKTNKEIATALFIAVSTVKSHVNSIYAKLAVTNRKEARVKYAQMPHTMPFL